MAFIKVCDVCGSQYKKDSVVEIKGIPTKAIYLMPSDIKKKSVRIDLCTDCAESFKKWVGSVKKVDA